DHRATLRKPNHRLRAQMLPDRGYATGGVVSSGLLRRATGVAQGFDFFDDPSTLPDADAAEDAELTPDQRRRDGSASETIAEHWLGTVGTTRGFLFLQLHDAHAT